MAVHFHTPGVVQRQDVSYQILVDYNTLGCPEQYFCKHCGNSGLRLWRRLGEEESLSCRRCTLRITGDTPAQPGEIKDPLPAIPSQVKDNGTLLFGYYNGIPKSGWDWWRGLNEEPVAA